VNQYRYRIKKISKSRKYFEMKPQNHFACFFYGQKADFNCTRKGERENSIRGFRKTIIEKKMESGKGRIGNKMRNKMRNNMKKK